MKKIVTIIIAIAVIVGAFFFFRSGDKKSHDVRDCRTEKRLY